MARLPSNTLSSSTPSSRKKACPRLLKATLSLTRRLFTPCTVTARLNVWWIAQPLFGECYCECLQDPLRADRTHCAPTGPIARRHIEIVPNSNKQFYTTWFVSLSAVLNPKFDYLPSKQTNYIPAHNRSDLNVLC